VSQPARRILLDVGDAGAPAPAVTNRRTNLGVRVADDDADVADARIHQRLDAVEEHGLVGDRNELFRAGVGQRAQSSTLAPTQDQSLHASH
jgi:hypothetical protein